MFAPSRNAPTVALLRLVLLAAHREPNAAFDQIAGLLVRRGMARQDSALAQAKLGQQRFLAVNQCLPLDPVQGRTVSAATSLLEHA